MHLVLLEGPSKKDAAEWMGRTDTNKRVVVPHTPLPDATRAGGGRGGDDDGGMALPLAGEYVAVRVTEALSANTLRAHGLARSSIAHFANAARRGHVDCW